MSNPTRLRITDYLYAIQAPQTATAITAVVPLKPSAMSYHLRVLGEHGVIQRADETRDGRERPWRAVAIGYSFVISPDVTVDTMSYLLDSRLEPMRQRMVEMLEIRSASGHANPSDVYMVLGSGDMWLTESETRSLTREVEAIWARYERVSQTRRSDESRLIRYMWSLLPDEPHNEIQELENRI